MNEDYNILTDRQKEAMPLVFAVLGAACVPYSAVDVLAVVHLVSRHPRLLSEAIGLSAEAIAGKENELLRRVDHPSPRVVDDPPNTEET